MQDLMANRSSNGGIRSLFMIPGTQPQEHVKDTVRQWVSPTPRPAKGKPSRSRNSLPDHSNLVLSRYGKGGPWALAALQPP